MSIKTTLIKTFTALSITLCTLSAGCATGDEDRYEGDNMTPPGGSPKDQDDR